jgi:glutamate dehydrogenase
MAVLNMPRAEEGEAGQTLVEAAAALLAARRSDIPRDFLIDLFERAAPDDLVRLSPEELAGIGEQSLSFLLQRQAGLPKIAFRPAPAGGIAVLDILNDDMPFLVDSVLGELAERAVDIRLLVHPVFTVERDQAGRLIAL